jgi:MFS family permease
MSANRREIRQLGVLFLLFLLNIGYGMTTANTSNRQFTSYLLIDRLFNCVLVATGYVENLAFAMPELAKPKSEGGMGLSISEGSVITAIADVGYVIGLFITGPIADRFGGKLVLVITLLGSSFFNIMCGMFNSVWSLTVFYTFSMLCRYDSIIVAIITTTR